jgi:hypothetical protein
MDFEQKNTRMQVALFIIFLAASPEAPIAFTLSTHHWPLEGSGRPGVPSSLRFGLPPYEAGPFPPLAVPARGPKSKPKHLNPVEHTLRYSTG